MIIVIATEDTSDHSSKWSGAVHRWLGEGKKYTHKFYTQSGGQSMPLDGDLYLLHGQVTAPMAVHLQDAQIMRFGSVVAGAINAPLDGLDITIAGVYGKDHGTLTNEMKLAIERRITTVATLPITQFHLSLAGDIEGVWQPRIPVGDIDPESLMKPKPKAELPDDILLSETQAPRICTSPTILGCFYGIYPNIHKQFEDPKCTHMDFFVYVATNYDPKQFMDQHEIIKNKIVWDAHLSLECNIFSSARMHLLAKKVRFLTHNKPFNDRKHHNWVHPYDDPTESEIYHSPIVEYAWKEM